jgi:uncharacterized protein (DUF1697 family)
MSRGGPDPHADSRTAGSSADPAADAERARVVLLRGVNVGGHARIEMAALRETCVGLGWATVRSYIQSGNVVARASQAAESMEARLRAAIELRWKLDVAVFVRDLAVWSRYVEVNPFPEEAAARPASVMLCVSHAVPTRDAALVLAARGTAGERVAEAGGALWIHYPAGAGRSRIETASIERALGSRISMRNWATVLRLLAMAGEIAGGGEG